MGSKGLGYRYTDLISWLAVRRAKTTRYFGGDHEQNPMWFTHPSLSAEENTGELDIGSTSATDFRDKQSRGLLRPRTVKLEYEVV